MGWMRQMSSPLPAPSRSGMSYSIPRTYRARPGSRSSPALAAATSRSLALPVIFGPVSTDRYDPSGSASISGSRRSDLTRHSSYAPLSAAAPVFPVVEVPVRHDQPLRVQPAVQLAG